MAGLTEPCQCKLIYIKEGNKTIIEDIIDAEHNDKIHPPIFDSENNKIPLEGNILEKVKHLRKSVERDMSNKKAIVFNKSKYAGSGSNVPILKGFNFCGLYVTTKKVHKREDFLKNCFETNYKKEDIDWVNRIAYHKIFHRNNLFKDISKNKLNKLAKQFKLSLKEVLRVHPTLKPVDLNTSILKLFLPPDLSSFKIYNGFAGTGSEYLGILKAGIRENSIYGSELNKTFYKVLKIRKNAYLKGWKSEQKTLF